MPDLNFWFMFFENKLLLRRDPPTPPQSAEPPLPPAGEPLNIGELLGKSCLCCRVNELPPADDWLALDLFQAHEILDSATYRMAGRAFQLDYWLQNSRFCPVCGEATRMHECGNAKVCPACSKMIFPKPTCAVLVLVQKEDQILLVRAHNFRAPFHGLVSGYLDVGETLEGCAAREVMEETGLSIDNIRYFGSETWPFPNNLMVGFTADYVSGEIVLQEEELAEAAFYGRSSFPRLPDKISLTRRMIDWWAEKN